MSLASKLSRVATGLHAALYRRIDSPRVRRIAGLPILLLTVKGRRSGKPIMTPVCFVEVEGGYAVAGSANGADTEPQWFRNLRAASEASVEVGADAHRVRVRVLPSAERDAVWARFLTEGMTFAGYEAKTERVIPIAELIRI